MQFLGLQICDFLHLVTLCLRMDFMQDKNVVSLGPTRGCELMYLQGSWYVCYDLK